MRATELHICLRNSGHSDLIKTTGQETRESACKRNGTMTCATADCNADQILLGDETLDVVIIAHFLQLQGMSRVLRVAVQSDNSWTRLVEFHQSTAVCFAGRNLKNRQKRMVDSVVSV